MEKFPILTNSEEEERFLKFLKLPDNERIIFSGIFGSGKTTFLNKFFKSNNEYVALHLYPVNYSVSSNEDIFEYIKYDLLYSLLDKKPKLDKLELSISSQLSYEKVYELLKVFVSLIPKIGKPVKEILEQLDELAKTLATKNVLDDGQSIKSFGEYLENQKGSIYEFDLYSQLIAKLINQLKDSEGRQREIVLIVDDLDRLDPDHIFRILNIFAAHFDQPNNYQNKFGINKVILCCDVDNIRTIFNTKFGQDVDFSGYIDRFFSKEIYHFNGKGLIINFIDSVLESVKHPYSAYLKDSQSQYSKLLSALITWMALSSKINLRTLIRIYNSKFVLSHYRIGMRGINTIQIPIIALFEFLIFIFGTKEIVLSKLKGSDFPDLSRVENTFFDLIMIIDHEQNDFELNKAYSIVVNGDTFTYTIEQNHSGYCAKPYGNNISRLKNKTYKEYFIDAFIKFSELRNLR